MTTAEPISFSDLSPELVEEFCPPCDMPRCPEVAEWVVRGVCGVCGPLQFLFGEGCKDKTLEWHRTIGAIHLADAAKFIVTGWERL